MRLLITPSGPELADPDDCTRFHAELSADLGGDRLRTLLAEHGLGRIDETGYRDTDSDTDSPDHVFVTIEALRALAGGRTDADWDARFDGMLAYAASKGWLDQDGTHVRAHVERS